MKNKINNNINSAREYILVLTTSVIVSIFSLILYKIILIEWGARELEEFSIIKRYQALLIPVLMLGLGVTLPLWLARRLIQIKTLIKVGVTKIIFMCILLGATARSNNIIYMGLLLTGPVLISNYMYSITRGLVDYARGIYLNVIYLVAMPIICLVVSKNITNYIYAYFTLSIVITPIIYRLLLVDIIKKYEKTIIGYGGNKEYETVIFEGIKRVPGDLVQQLLMLSPVIFFQNSKQQAAAAYFSLAISLAIAFVIPLKPISTILLVRLANVSLKDIRTGKILIIIFGLSLLIALIYKISLPLINLFYFNNDEFLSKLHEMIPFLFLYSMYVLLRSYVDALFKMPLMTYITLASSIFALPLLIINKIDPIEYIVAVKFLMVGAMIFFMGKKID